MKRMYFIDWLRISAEMVVLLTHAVSFFHPLDWHVKNQEQNNFWLISFQFLHMWIMPLFFFLAGASTIFIIKNSFKSFFASRIERLLVPLVFGVLVLIPPQKYLEAITHNLFTGGYFEFLMAYFGGDPRFFPFGIHFSLGFIDFSSYHLWFLVHLTLITLLLFPVLRFVYNKGAVLLDRINQLISFKGGAILMFIPIAVVYILMKKPFPDYTGWGDLSRNAMYLLCGFIFIRHEGLRQNLVNSRYLALIPATIFTVLYMTSFVTSGTILNDLFHNNQVYGYFVFQHSTVALGTWSWIVFFVGMGIKHMNYDSKYRHPSNELVLPFYMLHQTVLLLIGFVVVQWNWGIWSKFTFIFISSFVVILGIYFVAVKPFNFMRYLFGMKKKPVTQAIGKEPVLQEIPANSPPQPQPVVGRVN